MDNDLWMSLQSTRLRNIACPCAARSGLRGLLGGLAVPAGHVEDLGPLFSCGQDEWLGGHWTCKTEWPKAVSTSAAASSGWLWPKSAHGCVPGGPCEGCLEVRKVDLGRLKWSLLGPGILKVPALGLLGEAPSDGKLQHARYNPKVLRAGSQL